MKSRTLLALAALCASLLAPARLPAAVDLVDQGVEQFEAGDLAAARATLERALEAEGGHRALAHLGRVELAVGELDRAIELLRAAVELDQQDSSYRSWLGRAYIDKLQTVSFFERGVIAGRALDALRTAVELDPSNVEARVSLAGYYLNAPALAGGSKRKAREQAEAIVELDPPRAHGILAGIHIRDEEWDLAIERLDLCIAAQPEELGCRYQLGMLHQQLERYDQAFAAFEEILEIEPDSRGALYQIGRTAAFSGGRLTRGVECLQRYLSLEVEPGNPGHDGAHWRLGMLFERQGDLRRARTEFETAIELNPGEANYRDSLEQLGAG